MLKHHNIVFVVWVFKKSSKGCRGWGWVAITSYRPMAMKPCYKLVIALTLDDYGKYTTRALEVYFP